MPFVEARWPLPGRAALRGASVTPELSLGLAALGTFFGAAMQRVTGLGFALVSVPFLMLSLGPREGVLLANLLGLCTCIVVAVTTWQNICWRRTLTLILGAAVGIQLGAWTSLAIPAPYLMIATSAMVLVSLSLVSGASTRVTQALEASATGWQWKSRVLAGTISGFMNAAAGIGGPPVVVFGKAVRWPQMSFVASLQAYFIVLNAMALATKGMPALHWATVVTVLASLAVGVGTGFLLHRRIPQAIALRFTVWVAALGSLAVGIRGLLLIL